MQCNKDMILFFRDTFNVVSGKWRLTIVFILLSGKKRFVDIQHAIPSVTPRMISKELKELEVNGVVTRSVIASTPVQVEYELTPSGYQLKEVIESMVQWGKQHRNASLKAPQL